MKKTLIRLSNWKKTGKCEEIGDEVGYVIMRLDKRNENVKIKNPILRLLHFLIHKDYDGAEGLQPGTGKFLCSRMCGHNRRYAFNNTVDTFLVCQRLNNVKSVGLYYDAVPTDKKLYQVAESISIFGSKALDLETKNVAPGVKISEHLGRSSNNSDEFLCVSIQMNLRAMEDHFSLHETTDENVNNTQMRVAAILCNKKTSKKRKKR